MEGNYYLSGGKNTVARVFTEHLIVLDLALILSTISGNDYYLHFVNKENWIRSLSKVTQLGGSGATVQTQICVTTRAVPSPLI